MKRLKKFAAILLAGPIAWCIGVADSHAQVISEGHIDYGLGIFRIHETPQYISIFNGAVPVLTAKIKAGGTLDPDIHVDEKGILTAGSRQFDVKTGKLLPQQRASSCKQLQGARHNLLAIQSKRALMLRPKLNENARTIGYESRLLDLTSCVQLDRSLIAATDVANFFEFRASSRGWWLVGSDDSRILVSETGKIWHNLPLPVATHNVLSANWANNNEFWILANKLTGAKLSLVFYKSADLGLTWSELEASLANVPGYWFEAYREIAASMQN